MVSCFLVALHCSLQIWRSRHLFQSLETGFGRQNPSPVSLFRDSVWAIWWCLWSGLLLESLDGQVWVLDQQMRGLELDLLGELHIWICSDGPEAWVCVGIPGSWVYKVQPGTRTTEAGLVLGAWGPVWYWDDPGAWFPGNWPRSWAHGDQLETSVHRSCSRL